MTASITDLNVYRARRRPGLLREQLRASLENLSANCYGNFGPVPNKGYCLGDFVRLRDGSIGWVSAHRYAASGALIITVRCSGVARTLMARDCEPVSVG